MAAPRWFVPTLMVVCGLLLVAIVVGRVFHIAPGVKSTDFLDFPLVAAVTFTLVGGLVVPRQPHNPIGWLFISIGLSNALGVLGASFMGYHLMAWLSVWSPGVAYGLLPLTLLVFPDGRLPSRAWRPVAWVSAAFLSVVVVSLAVPAWTTRPWGAGRRYGCGLPGWVLQGSS